MIFKLFPEPSNRPDLKALFDELNALHFGGLIPPMALEWNTRLRITAGMCYTIRRGGYTVPTKIEMSDKLFAEHKYDSEMIRSTMIHEMCHAFIAVKYNETGHGPHFQYKMEEVTGDYSNHTCHSYDVSALRNQRRTMVAMFCESCQKQIGTKAKMPGWRSLSAGFTHRHCGGKVTFKKVDMNYDEVIIPKSIKLF